MNLRFLSLSCLLGVASLGAQSNLRVEMQRQEWNEDLTDIRLMFDSDVSRRYLIEITNDLSHWDPDQSTTHEFSEAGYWVRQLDASNPYTPTVEFYRVSRLPWVFQAIVDTNDWIGNVSLSSSEDSALLVYQNRDTNELFFAESNSDGLFPSPSVIASTGEVDQPGFWDNSGYADVTIAHYSGRTFIACTDYITKKVILLWKDDLANIWNRHEISDIIENHYWAFPKFSISSTGILGIAYADNSGTVFTSADHSSPESWTSVALTDSRPSNSASLNTVFSSENDAHVYIKYGGSYKISIGSMEVTNESFPVGQPSDLTEEEIDRINLADLGNESVSYVRLADDRILLILSRSGHITAAVEEE